MGDIIRVKKDAYHPYVVLSKHLTEDTSLSWEARGVMAYLLGKPDGWQVRMSDLVAKGPSGETKMRRILKELEEHGYLRRRRMQDDQGRFFWVSEIYEGHFLPFDEEPEEHSSPREDDLPAEDAESTDGEATGGESACGESTRGETICGKSTCGEPAYLISNDSVSNDLTLIDSVPPYVGTESISAPNASASEVNPNRKDHPKKRSRVQKGDSLPKEEDGESAQKLPSLESKHPAIRAFRHVTGRYPPKVLYKAIIATLGPNPDEAHMRTLFADWVSRGYNPMNIRGWLLEQYHKPRPKVAAPPPRPKEPAVEPRAVDDADGWERIDEHTVIIPIGQMR